MKMHSIAVCSIVLSVVLAAFNLVDEINGSVTTHSRRHIPHTYTKADSLSNFRKVMNYYWIRSALPALAGCVIFWLLRGQDRLDPTSPHFQGGKALDELSDYLDQELAKKKKAEQDAANP